MITLASKVRLVALSASLLGVAVSKDDGGQAYLRFGGAFLIVRKCRATRLCSPEACRVTVAKGDHERKRHIHARA